MPVTDLIPRHRELGRLRMGAKTTSKSGKEIPVKLKTWRLTSSNLEALHAASKLWGGEVEAWGEQYELVTTTSEIPVLVPPQDLQGSQWYTLYSGGGIVHRCNGVTDFETDGPCVCDPEKRECEVTTHLQLVLPQLPDIGVWRLTTRGWNAAVELANTIDMLQQFVARGQMPEAIVAIEPRTAKRDGKTHSFIVPVLRIPRTLEALTQMEGRTALPGRPFDPSTGEVLEDEELPAGSSGQEGAAGSESDGAGPADTTEDSPAEHRVSESTAARQAAEDASLAETEESDPDTPANGEARPAQSAPQGTTHSDSGPGSAGDLDDGTPATAEQWALLERHRDRKLTPTKVMIRAKHLFPKAGIRSKSDITKHQFSKAFATLMDEAV